MILMRNSLALMSIFVLLGAITRRGDDVLPSRLNFDRYSAMVDHSPFAIATAVALPAATPDFAKDLYVANVAHSPDGDMVTIASSSDSNFKKYLITREPVDGYSIVSVEWSDRVGATKVTIGKDGRLATLTFNEALLSQRGAANALPAPGQMPPSMPPMPSLAPIQTLGARVDDKIHRKPGAAAISPPNPQQQQERELRHQRQREQKLEIGRKRQAVSQRP